MKIIVIQQHHFNFKIDDRPIKCKNHKERYDKCQKKIYCK